MLNSSLRVFADRPARRPRWGSVRRILPGFHCCTCTVTRPLITLHAATWSVVHHASARQHVLAPGCPPPDQDALSEPSEAVPLARAQNPQYSSQIYQIYRVDYVGKRKLQLGPLFRTLCCMKGRCVLRVSAGSCGQRRRPDPCSMALGCVTRAIALNWVAMVPAYERTPHLRRFRA